MIIPTRGFALTCTRGIMDSVCFQLSQKSSSRASNLVVSRQINANHAKSGTRDIVRSASASFVILKSTRAFMAFRGRTTGTSPSYFSAPSSFRPDLLHKSERLGSSFSSRLEPVAISNMALKTDPALWGNFLRGLNVNFSVPPGPLPEVEHLLSSGSLKLGLRNMFFESHLAQR